MFYELLTAKGATGRPTDNWTLIKLSLAASPQLPAPSDLAAQCGDDFAGGVLIHAGAHRVTLGDPRFLAVPLAKLWEK